jgi:hypothetical protein
MKKTCALVSLLLLLAAVGFAQSFALKIGGGFGIINGGDLTTGIQGVSDYLAQTFQSTGAFTPPKSGVHFAAELVWYPWKHIGLGVGGGYFQTTKESSVSYGFSALTVQETIKPKVTVMPLTLNLHWNIFLLSWLHVDIFGGPGLYSTKLDWRYTNSYKMAPYDGSEAYTFSASKSALGWQGGLGLEFLISSRLAVVLSAQARAASIGPFTKGTWSDAWSGALSQSSGSGSDHTFWAYDYATAAAAFSQISFQGDTPKGDPAIANVRTAKIDLKGIAATAGIRWAF